jgi:tetratricopeptide (TPR) repeat protein
MMRLNTVWSTARLALVLVLTGLAFQGCDDDDDTPGAPLPSVSGAWSEFQAGDWSQAHTAFLQALAANPEHAEALCGLAWSQAMLDGTDGADYRQAIEENFLLADQLRSGYLDAWAGLANFYSAQSQPLLAVEWSLDLLAQAGESYTFSHRTQVNSRSLHGIAAWNLFKLARYDEAVDQVQAVFPDYNPNPADPLYLETLLARIGDI